MARACPAAVLYFFLSNNFSAGPLSYIIDLCATACSLPPWLQPLLPVSGCMDWLPMRGPEHLPHRRRRLGSTKTLPPSFIAPAHPAIARASPDRSPSSLTTTCANVRRKSPWLRSGATCHHGCLTRVMVIFRGSGALRTARSTLSSSGCGRALRRALPPTPLRCRSSFPAGNSASRTW
jgi:hypothetical protein